jgi:hypothetical protein
MLVRADVHDEEEEPSLEEGSGYYSNCGPPPGPKHAEASFYILFSDDEEHDPQRSARRARAKRERDDDWERHVIHSFKP